MPSNFVNLLKILQTQMIFFDIQNSSEFLDGQSRSNHDEARFTKTLIEMIAFSDSKNGCLRSIKGQIGIITPYKSQVRTLKN